MNLESDDLDFEQFEKELEKFDKYLASTQDSLDKLFNILDFSIELKDKALEFNNNISQLDKLIDVVSEKDFFAIGCLICSLSSVFEGFIHDFIELAVKSEKNIDNTSFINKVNQKQGRSQNKEHKSFEDIMNDYRKKTLNQPSKILELLNDLFNFNVTYKSNILDKKDFFIISRRNAFTHNNGYINGLFQEITIAEVKDIRDYLVKVIDVLSNSLIAHFSNHQSQIEQNSNLDNDNENNQ